MKLTKYSINQNLSEIGIIGIAIRAVGYLTHFFSEDNLVYKKVGKIIAGFRDDAPKYINHMEVSEGAPGNKIWVAWFQGKGLMPDLVEKCYNNLLKLSKGHEIILLTLDNLEKYVDIPEHILHKRSEGIIKIQQFADIVRTAVLYQKGGLWIDSTMWLSNPIPSEIWQQDFFLFKYFDKNTHQIGSIQFLRSKPGNQILGETLEMLCRYWDKYNKSVSYYQWHYFLANVVNSKEQYKAQIAQIPKYCSEINHILQDIFFDEFDDEYWNYLKQLTFVHKLSYKHLDQKKVTNTYYGMFLDGKLK